MQITFVLPRPADTGGGNGLAYAHGMAAALRTLGHVVDIQEGEEPDFQAGATPVVDGLLLPQLMPRLQELVASDAVALIHHVSARASQDVATRASVQGIERAMLPALRGIVTTSHPVAEQLQQQFGLSDITVVPPGANDLPRSSFAKDSVPILSVGVLTRRKGHDTLLRALAALSDLEWSLTIAGSAMRDPVHASQLRALIPELGLTSRARVVADPDPATLEQLWQGAGLFALATRWEGYPAGIMEALRRGLPVVVTAGGAAGEVVPADAGAVCLLDDVATLSKCLRRVLFDHALRADMAEGAWRAGQAQPDWPAQARLLAAALKGHRCRS